MQQQVPPAPQQEAAVAGPSSSATEQQEEEEEAAAVLPSLESLLSVPLAFVARHTSNRREAEALLQVSLLAARLDSLLACLGTAARQAAQAHGQAQAIQRMPDPRVRTLLPLLRELELQRRHDLRALREETEECARALERHKEMFTWSACTHASHAEQVQSFMPHLANAARRMAAVFQEVVARLDTLLLPEIHAVPSPSSFSAQQQQPCFSLYQHCRRADNGQGWVTMAEFVEALERGGLSPHPSQASPASRRTPVPAATVGKDGAGEEAQAHPQQQQQANHQKEEGAASSSISSVHGAEPSSTSSSSSTTMSGGDGGGVCLPSASKKRPAAGAGLAAEEAAGEGEGKEGAKKDQTHGSGAEEEEAAKKRARAEAEGQQQQQQLPPSIEPALTPSAAAAPPLPPPLSPAPSPALQLDAGVTPQHSATQRSTRTVLDEEEDEEDHGAEGQVEEDGGEAQLPDDVFATALDGGAQDPGDTAAPFFTAAAPEEPAASAAADGKLPPAYPLSGIVLLTSSSSSSSSSGAVQQGMVGGRERFSQGSATSSQ